MTDYVKETMLAFLADIEPEQLKDVVKQMFVEIVELMIDMDLNEDEMMNFIAYAYHCKVASKEINLEEFQNLCYK